MPPALEVKTEIPGQMRRASLVLVFLCLILSPAVAQELTKATPKQYKVAEADTSGSVSPDGRFLLYTDWRELSIHVRDLKTGEDRRLIDGWFPKISPDGKQVAYGASNKEGFEELRIVNLEDGEPRIVYSNREIGWIEPKEWSPDGKQILVVLLRSDRTKNQIAMVSVASTSLRILKELTDWRTPGKMSFSPDGRYIAYDFPPHEDSPQRDIFVLRTDSARQVPLVEHPDDDLLLGWTPDGKEVSFASNRTGTWDAWLVKATNGRPRGAPKLVKRDLGAIWQGLGFARDGSYYYGALDWVNDVYVSAFDPATGQLQPPRKLASDVGFDTSIEWSPDGQRLAYVLGHGYELYSFVLGVRSFVPEAERRLRLKMTRFGSHAFEPHWSPDGGFLLAQGRDRKGPQGRQGLYRINAQSGEVVLAVPRGREEGGLLEWPVWRPDGKVIFTRWKRWPGRTIVIRDLESGREEELYEVAPPVGIARLAVSPDGQRLAFVQWDSKTGMAALVVMPLSGREAREIVKLPPQELTYSQPLFALAWTPDSRHIIYAPTMAGQNSKFELWRISAEGGEPQSLGVTMKGLPYGINVHPDGHRIAFTAGTPPRAEVWALENFLPGSKSKR